EMAPDDHRRTEARKPAALWLHTARSGRATPEVGRTAGVRMGRRLLSPVEGVKSLLWCCITPERMHKTGRLMDAIAMGAGGHVILGPPPAGTDPFCLWGQMWLALRVLPGAHEAGRQFFHVDNGFIRPARGSRYGYYRITYRSLSPILLSDPP